MELPDRDHRDEKLAAAMLVLFGEQRAEILKSGHNANWRDFELRLEAVISQHLEDTYRLAAIAMFLLALGRDFVPAIIGASQWIARWAPILASRIVRVSRPLVSQELDIGTAVSLRDRLDKEFGSNRATTIARTETTRANTAGEDEADRKITNNRHSDGKKQFTMQRERFWFTRKDDKVCPVCEPLHNKPENHWANFIPSGPPAHPNCRCWLRYVYSQVPVKELQTQDS